MPHLPYPPLPLTKNIKPNSVNSCFNITTLENYCFYTGIFNTFEKTFKQEMDWYNLGKDKHKIKKIHQYSF